MHTYAFSTQHIEFWKALFVLFKKDLNKLQFTQLPAKYIDVAVATCHSDTELHIKLTRHVH